MALDHDQNRVVNPDRADFWLVYDQARVGWDQGRPLSQPPVFDPLVVAWDKGKIVHDSINTRFIAHDATVSWDQGRLAIDGGTTEIPFIPLVPPTLDPSRKQRLRGFTKNVGRTINP